MPVRNETPSRTEPIDDRSNTASRAVRVGGRQRKLAAALAGTCIALAACSGPQGAPTAATESTCGSSYRLDSYTIPTCGPLRLAVFLPGTNNADLQSRIAYLEDAVPKIPGATMTIFDAKFDATTQLNQIQTAIQTRQFNAAIAGPIDGVLLCDALSKQAPAAGILVTVPNLALCGRTAEEGEALRAPGTLTYVGGTQSPAYWSDYLSWIVAKSPGPQKVLALTDPAAPFPLTANFEKALAQVSSAHPEFQVVGTATTDLTVAGSFQKMAALAQAHQDATILITMYSTETQGAVQALGQSPLAGRLKIYDKGATPWAVAALKSGSIVATSPERAVTSTATMLTALVDARAGKAVPSFFGRDGADAAPGAPPSGFEVFTSGTIGDYAGQGG